MEYQQEIPLHFIEETLSKQKNQETYYRDYEIDQFMKVNQELLITEHNIEKIEYEQLSIKPISYLTIHKNNLKQFQRQTDKKEQIDCQIDNLCNQQQKIQEDVSQNEGKSKKYQLQSENIIKKDDELQNLKKFEIYQVFQNQWTDVRFHYYQDKQIFTIKKYLNNNAKEEFQNEIEILTELKDSNISLSILGFGEENGKFYFEQIAGQKDLSMVKDVYNKYVDENFDNINSIVDFLSVHFLKLFDKLERLHTLGYAHSDIKPQNIVFGYDKEVYFIDFGGAVELQNYSSYLNQYTPSYNLQIYLKQYNENGIIQYEKQVFDNIEEVKLCDFSQLALTFISMLCLDTKDILNFKQRKINEVLNNFQIQNTYMLRLCSQILNKADPIIKVIGEPITKEIPFIINHSSIMYLNDIIFDIYYNYEKQLLQVQGINKYNVYLLEMIDSVFGNVIYDTSEIRINPEPTINKFYEFCDRKSNIRDYQTQLRKGGELNYFDAYNLCQMILTSKDTIFQINLIEEFPYFEQIIQSIKFAKFKDTLKFDFYFANGYSITSYYVEELSQFNVLQVSEDEIVHIKLNLKQPNKNNIFELFEDFNNINEDKKIINKIMSKKQNSYTLFKCYLVNISTNLKKCKQVVNQFQANCESNKQDQKFNLVFISSMTEENFQDYYEQDQNVNDFYEEGFNEYYADFEDQNEISENNSLNGEQNQIYNYSLKQQQKNQKQLQDQDESPEKKDKQQFKNDESELFFTSIEYLIFNNQNHYQLIIGLFNFKIEEISIISSIKKLIENNAGLLIKVELVECEINEQIIQEIGNIGKINQLQDYNEQIKDNLKNDKGYYLIQFLQSDNEKQQSNMIQFDIYLQKQNSINQGGVNNSQECQKFQGIDKKGIINILSHNKIIEVENIRKNQLKTINDSFSFPELFQFQNKQFIGYSIEDIKYIIDQIKIGIEYQSITIIIDKFIIKYQNNYQNMELNFKDLNINSIQSDLLDYEIYLIAYFHLYFALVRQQNSKHYQIKLTCSTIYQNELKGFSKIFKLKQKNNIIEIKTCYYYGFGDNKQVIKESMKILKIIEEGKNNSIQLFQNEFQKDQNENLLIQESSIKISESYSTMSNGGFIIILKELLDYKVNQVLILKFEESKNLSDEIFDKIYRTLKLQKQVQNIQFHLRGKDFSYQLFKDVFLNILSDKNPNNFIFNISCYREGIDDIKKNLPQYIIGEDNEYLTISNQISDQKDNSSSRYTFYLQLHKYTTIFLNKKKKINFKYLK